MITIDLDQIPHPCLCDREWIPCSKTLSNSNISFYGGPFCQNTSSLEDCKKKIGEHFYCEKSATCISAGTTINDGSFSS